MAPRWRPAPLGLLVGGCLLLGVLAVQSLPALPPPELSWLAVALGIAAWLRSSSLRCLGSAVLGAGLACLQAQAALALQVPASLSGVPLVVEGRITGLPVSGGEAVRFELQVESGEGAAALLAGRRLRLGWYAHGREPPNLAAGSRWRLRVTLRRPHGLVNPGGFDFERRALEHRIAAIGYVRDGPGNLPLGPAQGMDALRERLSKRIAAAVPGTGSRFVRALALGDTRSLDDRDWEVLRANGLTHLIAISGFHVGLVAGLGALMGQAGYWLVPRLGRRCPRPQGVALAALAFAAAYTVLAGYALPTVRTLLMIATVTLVSFARRRPGLSASLGIALVAVLLADPLSVLAPGFWLSFLGVAWLLWCLPGGNSIGVMQPFLQAQAVAMLGLLPLSVWFFNQASLAGPLVNLVGIPWISLAVVPLSLLGLALDPLAAPAGALCWQAAAAMMQWLWLLTESVASWPWAVRWLPEPRLGAVLLALASAFWLTLPRGVPGKALASLLLLPLLWPALDRPRHGEAELWLLDVGQGLALVVITRHHALLYDAGPATPRGLDLGEAVVVPALRSLGLDRLDAMVISHGDSDHAGGAAAVQRAVPAARTLAPPGWAHGGMAACRSGDGWEWDGVRFTVLHPGQHFPYLRNESSCVLHVQAQGASALLPGDIGRHVEARLARLPPARVAADVLLVPHHGSESSSSLDLLAAVRPRVALLAVGQGNRFGLPKPKVLARYERYGVEVLDTASNGAIALRLGRDGVGVKLRLRQDRRRYWRHAGPGGTGYAIGGHEPEG